MVKTILKEVCIMVLLCIAIILVFGIVFYDYIPINKVIPNKVTYTVPEDIQTELQTDISVEEIQPQNIVYSITGQDLKEYEDSGVYLPGNPNPFQSYSSITNSLVPEDGNTVENSLKKNTTTYYPTNTSTK